MLLQMFHIRETKILSAHLNIALSCGECQGLYDYFRWQNLAEKRLMKTLMVG